MRIVFFGSKECSVSFLRELQKSNEIAAAVTSPDKPSGRGMEVHSSPVKAFAKNNKISVFEPDNLKDNGFIEQVSRLNPDIAVVVAYGKLLPKEIFYLPKYKTINVHFSLLPKYRGAAPIQRALINGDNVTGISVFFIEEKLDTGQVILQKEVPINLDDDSVSLEKKLCCAGLEVLSRSLDMLQAGFVPVPQKGTASAAPILKKQDGHINWQAKSAEQIINLIRATKPWPGAFTCYNINGKEKYLKIIKADANQNYCADVKANPGEIAGIVKGAGFVVKCKEGYLLIEEVQPENSKLMPAWGFWQGSHLKVGDRFI